MSKINSSKTYGGFSRFIKGIIVSLIITFSLIILFAFSLKWLSLEDSIISPVNLCIKGISIAIGALIYTKRASRGLIKGALFGIIYTAVTFTMFSLIAGVFDINIGLLLDITFSIIVGSIMGIIGVNSKK